MNDTEETRIRAAMAADEKAVADVAAVIAANPPPMSRPVFLSFKERKRTLGDCANLLAGGFSWSVGCFFAVTIALFLSVGNNNVTKIIAAPIWLLAVVAFWKTFCWYSVMVMQLLEAATGVDLRSHVVSRILLRPSI